MPAEPRRTITPPQTDKLIESTIVSQRELEARRQQAEQARRHASAIGDYAAAESWYRRARVLDEQLAARGSIETNP